jgi:outer membrane protein TolC
MKWEKVKPKLNVEYTVLSGAPPAIPMEGQQGGRKLGVDFKMPIFLREERGELTLNRIKLRDNGLQQETKRQELTAKFEAFSVETRRLSEQIVAFQKAVENARLLLEAERVRFLSGESSVFLVNQRELSYLESRRKLNQLVAKFYKAKAGLNWSIASFPEPE